MSSLLVKLKWIGCALLAGLMAVAAFLYGRQTPRVERVAAAKKAARVRVLEVELEAARKDAAAADASSKASVHIAKANTIESKLRVIRGDREDAIHAVPDDDDDLALRDNLRRRERSRANGAA